MKHDDTGSVTLYTVIMMTALLAALGLVVDVGASTAAKGRAIHAAYAAARAGAEELSVEAFVTTGRVDLNPTAARRAALAYLARVGLANGALITVTGSTVQVTVHSTQHPQILNAFGLTSLTVTGSGEATAQYGGGAS